MRSDEVRSVRLADHFNPTSAKRIILMQPPIARAPSPFSHFTWQLVVRLARRGAFVRESAFDPIFKWLCLIPYVLLGSTSDLKTHYPAIPLRQSERMSLVVKPSKKTIEKDYDRSARKYPSNEGNT